MAGGYPPQQQPGYQQQPPQGYGQPPQGYGVPQQMGQPGAVVDPNAPYGIDPKTGIPYSDKQKMVAGLLQVLLASFAVGRFYTGHTGIAIAQICVTWLLCGMGVFWPLIDGIMMLVGDPTDAQGRPLRPN
jgi:TM2 domain-containing membrane protein YozV